MRSLCYILRLLMALALFGHAASKASAWAHHPPVAVIVPTASCSSSPDSSRAYLYAHADPVNGVDPSGHEFSIAGVNVATAIQFTLRTMAYGAIIGGAVGQWDAIIGGRDSIEGLKEGAISGALLGPFARFRVIQLLGISYGAVQTGIAIGDGQNGLATYRAVVTAAGAALFVAGDVYVSKVNVTPRYTVADVRAAIARLEAKGVKPNEFQSHIDPDQVIKIAELMRSGGFDPALMSDPVIFETTSKSLLSGHHRSIAAEMAGFDLPQTPTAAPGTTAGEWSEIPLIPGRRN